MNTTTRRKRQTYTRREGARLNPDALDAHLVARGLGTRDLAKLTGLEIGTITDARQGKRLRRSTVMKIVAALDKLPVNSTVAALVGVAVPAAQTKTASGHHSRAVKRVEGRTSATRAS
jgi:hypothetical protein